MRLSLSVSLQSSEYIHNNMAGYYISNFEVKESQIFIFKSFIWLRVKNLLLIFWTLTFFFASLILKFEMCCPFGHFFSVVSYLRNSFRSNECHLRDVRSFSCTLHCNAQQKLLKFIQCTQSKLDNLCMATGDQAFFSFFFCSFIKITFTILIKSRVNIFDGSDEIWCHLVEIYV